MNRLKLFRLVGLMAMALLGLIGLQVYWIRQDLENKSEMFDQNVLLSARSLVEKIEERENLRFVIDRMVSTRDSMRSSPLDNDTLLAWINAMTMQNNVQQMPQEADRGELRERIQSAIDQYEETGQLEQTPLSFRDSGIDIRIEKNIEKREVIDLNLNSDMWMTDSSSAKWQSRLDRISTLMEKLTFEVSSLPKPFPERLPPLYLDSLLRTELKSNYIDTRFEYGVLDKPEGNFVLLSDSNSIDEVRRTNYRFALFPSDILQPGYQLHLSFPLRSNFLFRELWPMLLSAVLFTLIIILVFYRTVVIILKQKKLADVKNDFINNMTHEFKTPIATISLANESIRDPRISQDAQQMDYFTRVIREENQRMLKQVEKVLQMAQLDKGEVKLNKSVLNLHELIQESIQSMELSVKHRQGSIHFYPGAGEPRVWADPDHLRNVILNLLDNAVKYSPDAPFIEISTLETEDRVYFKVSDKGIGMSREVQKRVFDTFYREQLGNIHDVKGFGLGLSYVKAIVEMHGGTVEVWSEPGAGSTFTVGLPLKLNEWKS